MNPTTLLVCFSIIATVQGMPTGQSTSCCKSKTVGGVSYTFSSQMDTTAFNCISNCAYHKDGDTRVQYCFAVGNEDAVCTDDQVEDVAEVEGILITGGLGLGAWQTTEVFLPGSGKICELAVLPNQRYSHTLDTVGTTAVLCGGGSDRGDIRKSCLQFSPTTGTWTSYATTLEPRIEHTSWVSPAGLVLVAGDYSLTTAEIVTAGMNFTLVKPTRYACSISAGDSTIITGIIGEVGETPRTVSRYNLQGHVEDLPSLIEGRWDHGCGAYQDGDDRILVVAGGLYLGAKFSSTEVHILGSSAWTAAQPLPKINWSMASVSLDHEVLMFGGNANHLANFDILSYSGGSWKNMGQLVYNRYQAAATKIWVNSTVCD